MFSFFIVAISALCSTQATGLTQKINDLHLHAKLGEGLPESVPLITDSLDLVDEHVSLEAQKMVKKQMQINFLFKAMYGPIENVVLPGVKLSRPVILKNIRMTGLRGLRLNGLQWRMASNRVMCSATLPSLLIDVTFDNVQIELDENFGNEELYTDIRLSVRLLDLEIFASARYNMLTDTDLFIDKAEVDINAREALLELKVVQGLEEVRYILSELLNNSLEVIMDAVLKVVVKEINKELLKVDPKNVTEYLISKVPRKSKVPKELIVINRI